MAKPARQREAFYCWDTDDADDLQQKKWGKKPKNFTATFSISISTAQIILRSGSEKNHKQFRSYGHPTAGCQLLVVKAKKHAGLSCFCVFDQTLFQTNEEW